MKRTFEDDKQSVNDHIDTIDMNVLCRYTNSLCNKKFIFSTELVLCVLTFGEKYIIIIIIINCIY